MQPAVAQIEPPPEWIVQAVLAQFEPPIHQKRFFYSCGLGGGGVEGDLAGEEAREEQIAGFAEVLDLAL